MMTEEDLSLLALAAGAALVVAGCGSGSDTTSSSSTAAAASKAPAAADPRPPRARHPAAPNGGGRRWSRSANTPKLGKISSTRKASPSTTSRRTRAPSRPATATARRSGRRSLTSGAPKAEGGAEASKLGTTEAHRRHHPGDLRRAPVYSYVADKKPGRNDRQRLRLVRRPVVRADAGEGEEARRLGLAQRHLRAPGGDRRHQLAKLLESRGASAPGSSPGRGWPPRGSKKRDADPGPAREAGEVRRCPRSRPGRCSPRGPRSPAGRPRCGPAARLPREMVPSGKIPMQAPARSSETARSSAAASPAPRSIGICPMPSRTGAEAADLPEVRFRQCADLPPAAGRERRSAPGPSGCRGCRPPTAARSPAAPRAPRPEPAPEPEQP